MRITKTWPSSVISAEGFAGGGAGRGSVTGIGEMPYDSTGSEVEGRAGIADEEPDADADADVSPVVKVGVVEFAMVSVLSK